MNVLVIDDSTFLCEMIRQILEKENYRVIAMHDAQQAFDWLATNTPDLILLDFVLPAMDGFEICVLLKKMHRLKDVPVLFLTSNSDVTSIVKAFEAGAIDYIVKPFSSAELRARVSCHLQNKLMADELRLANKKLEIAMNEIRMQGLKDPLTNLFNRRFFLENFADWKNRSTSGEAAFLMLVDVDGFKGINDQFGHCSGDYVLYTISDIMIHALDGESIVGRWGGDEFLILILNADADYAIDKAERIREEIAAYDFQYDSHHMSCSITVGISPLEPSLDIEQNIAQADNALYHGKKDGKNCCCFLSQTIEPFLPENQNTGFFSQEELKP